MRIRTTTSTHQDNAIVAGAHKLATIEANHHQVTPLGVEDGHAVKIKTAMIADPVT